ncbi:MULTISPECIES: hypothetical protein [unclassified Rathayibacter]|uniref:hypothetical protein n=1 Tax=unclassified Rathayibacter TaxID=2609250 RepID=UPI00188C5799|nr:MULTISPECIES: hypothetical protein [unclassified Rathayibacter]MBF4461360.1 hypothetical protein [Rathayibacter sp. VKM Ac-2879]MBF4502771.1 hypothetical protein [Rathayibacter sp. VKM Ac-2878]
MSADQSPEFAGFEGTPSVEVGRADDVGPSDVEVEENTGADESRDPDHGYDPRAESGTENTATDEVSSSEDEDSLLPPGSTAEGAGTSMGAVPAEARREAAPLGDPADSAASSQLADERWRTNGVDPLA